MFYINVILDKSFNSLFQEYSYLVEQKDYEKLNIGSVVEVNFRHATRKAFVTNKGLFNQNEPQEYETKLINHVINYEGLNAYQLDLYNNLKDNYVNDHFQILNQLIKNSDKIDPKDLKMRTEIAYEFLKEEDLNDEEAMLILELIKQNKTLSKRQLKTFLTLKDSKLKKLIDVGCIKKVDMLYQYNPKINKKEKIKYEKVEIFDSLRENINLLLPGSHRDGIFQELFEKTLEANEQLLILVPEVGLTYDFFAFINDKYQQNCIIINQKTTNKEMQYYCHLIRNNLVNIVIGTKKSLFLPFVNLTTLVVDNAHDFNYYNNIAPFYNLIDLVERLNIKHKILVSDTPDLTTYTKAKKELYNFIEYQASEPKIELTPISDYEQILSVDNLIKVKTLIDEDKKVLIYYNYQGYASYVKCDTCGTYKTCPNCHKPLRYFQNEDILVCSSCNIKYPNYDTCQICHTKDNFTTGGIGIEKVLEVLNNYFLDDIVYMDASKVAKVSEYNKLVDEIKQKHIVLATQAITNLNIVKEFSYAIVLNSDTAYYSYNPYLVEKTYQDIFAIAMKVNSTSVQTKLSNTHLFSSLDSYKDFYNQEMQLRKSKAELPYYNICVINTYYNNIDVLKYFNQKIEKYCKTKNIMIENFDVKKASKFNYNYKQTVRIKYKKEQMHKILNNIYENALEQKIVIEIKDKYNNYT